MDIKISKITKLPSKSNNIYLIKKENDLLNFSLLDDEKKYLKTEINNKNKQIIINNYNRWKYFIVIEEKKEIYQTKEALRNAANKLFSVIKQNKNINIYFADTLLNPEYTLAFVEGLALSNYQFLKYY